MKVDLALFNATLTALVGIAHTSQKTVHELLLGANYNMTCIQYITPSTKMILQYE